MFLCIDARSSEEEHLSEEEESTGVSWSQPPPCQWISHKDHRNMIDFQVCRTALDGTKEEMKSKKYVFIY